MSTNRASIIRHRQLGVLLMFEKFSGKEHALLICNHRSDIDWLVGWVLAQVVVVVFIIVIIFLRFRT